MSYYISPRQLQTHLSKNFFLSDLLLPDVLCLTAVSDNGLILWRRGI